MRDKSRPPYSLGLTDTPIELAVVPLVLLNTSLDDPEVESVKLVDRLLVTHRILAAGTTGFDGA
jgi:hypothetical protein